MFINHLQKRITDKLRQLGVKFIFILQKKNGRSDRMVAYLPYYYTCVSVTNLNISLNLTERSDGSRPWPRPWSHSTILL